MIRVSPGRIGDQGNGYIAHVCVATIQAILLSGTHDIINIPVDHKKPLAVLGRLSIALYADRY